MPTLSANELSARDAVTALVRRALLLLALLLVAANASALAPREEAMRYVVRDDGPARFVQLVGGEWMGVNGVALIPRDGETTLAIRVEDAAGPSVPLAMCHEWTFDDGSHPRVTCTARACGPTASLALTPRPEGATYQRVIVFLFDEPWGCASRATAGRVVGTFT